MAQLITDISFIFFFSFVDCVSNIMTRTLRSIYAIWTYLAMHFALLPFD